ncbi:hypothetical protein M413DRAFT_446570 [Hebeloma cylindrosporum]|uniref:Uncharacterized protein n=1 Tax=Hebeloma cylindrosporum TaxID=76867 RepID=A0A0C3BUN7_HEBCY|nr:hypothetical protein M413DRAFT_446570 [Hebeloma cylindrosporum h7]
MPSIRMTETMKYHFEWEDLHRESPYLDSMLRSVGSSREDQIAISKNYRKISGTKRVEKYKQKQKQANGVAATEEDEPQVEDMESISETDFEEPRVDGYNQSTVATGSASASHEAGGNPSLKDVKEEDSVDDVAMQD